MTANKSYSDVHITVQGEDRIIAGADIPLINRGQPRPLRDKKRALIWRDCAYSTGSELVCMIKPQQGYL